MYIGIHIKINIYIYMAYRILQAHVDHQYIDAYVSRHLVGPFSAPPVFSNARSFGMVEPKTTDQKTASLNDLHQTLNGNMNLPWEIVRWVYQKVQMDVHPYIYSYYII
jgi:hypothetical protein